MKRRFNISLALLRAATIFAASITTASSAFCQETHWNVDAKASNPAHGAVIGSFDYDTVAGTIVDWDLIASGFIQVNTNFVPPTSFTLQPCASECSAGVFTIGGTSDNLAAFQTTDKSRNPPLLVAVGLAFPTTASLSGRLGAIISIDSQQSYAVAENAVNPLLGYSPTSPLIGSISYGGSVLNNFQGGKTAANPVALSLWDTIRLAGVFGKITFNLGGSYGMASFYSYSKLCIGCIHETATAAITGAGPNDSYIFKMLDTRSNVLQSVILDATNGFRGGLSVTQPETWYVVGVVANVPNAPDPTVSITFSSPVVSVAPTPPCDRRR